MSLVSNSSSFPLSVFKSVIMLNYFFFVDVSRFFFLYNCICLLASLPLFFNWHAQSLNVVTNRNGSLTLFEISPNPLLETLLKQLSIFYSN